MRDSMLDEGNAYFGAYRRAGEAARSEASELPEADEIISGLVEWCRFLLLGTNTIDEWEDGQSLSSLLVLPSDQSPLQAFEKLADVSRRDVHRKAFEGLLEGSERRDTNLMAWLLGKALAEALVECLEASHERPVYPVTGFRNLASSHDVSHFAFEETVQGLLRDHPSALTAVLADLERHIETLMQDPGIGTYTREREPFNQAVEAWRSKRSIDELWKMRGHWVPVRYSELELVACIVPVDRAAVFDRLDRFDFPHPVRQILEDRSIQNDREEIAAILKAVPSCSDKGGSWNYRLSALLVLETAESHCHELWRAASRAHDEGKTHSEIMKETEATLSSWMGQLGTIVMARPDGRFLGPQWLLLKIADERMDRARRSRAEDRGSDLLRQEDLIEWIALGLSKAGIQGRDIEALVQFPESSNLEKVSPLKPFSSDDEKEDPRLGALSMSAFIDHMIGEVSEKGVRTLLERLDTLLAFRDRAFETEGILASDSRGLPANCCGYLFANTSGPAERWRQSWSLLVEQRRRAQHWHEMKDGDALASSLFLLAAGTAAVEWLMSSQHRNSAKEIELWRAVFDAARECWLTIFLPPVSAQVDAHIGRLFALHPGVFGESNVQERIYAADSVAVGDHYSECLAQDLFSLGGNDLVLVICFLNAHHNGASLATMRAVLKWHEGHIDAVLNQFERWQEAERPVRRRSDLVEKLAGVRAGISRLENL